jgi:uncharacterized protein DUF4145
VYDGWVGGPHELACLDCGFVHKVWLSSTGVSLQKVESVTRFTTPSMLGVSDLVADDVREGIRAANAGCPRAAVVMLRRAVERACLDAGASKSDVLYTKIETLKKQGIITAVRASAAHAIRAFANEYGAHPDDDFLDEVSDEELEAAISITRAVVEGLAKQAASP